MWFPAVLIVALLAGCSATPTPQATTPPAAGPSATPDAPDAQPVDLSAPEPYLLATCSELAEDATINALADEVLKRYDPRVPEYNSDGYGLPYNYTLQQAQTLQCGWTSKADSSDEKYSNLSITVLPNGESAWTSYAEAYRIDSDHDLQCYGEKKEPQECVWEGLVGSNWLSVRYSAMKYFGSNKATLDAFTPLVKSVKAAVAESETGESWSEPSDTVAIERACPSVLTADVVTAAYGLKSEKVNFYGGGIGGTSIEFEAARMIGAGQCLWSFSGMQSEYGNPIAVLPGGQWAWEEARADSNDFFSTKELALDGLAEGDVALIGGSEYASTVDLLIGRNWIHITANKADFATFKLDRVKTLTTLAQGVVDEIRK